jgi:hypothetical protein
MMTVIRIDNNEECESNSNRDIVDDSSRGSRVYWHYSCYKMYAMHHSLTSLTTLCEGLRAHRVRHGNEE